MQPNACPSLPCTTEQTVSKRWPHGDQQRSSTCRQLSLDTRCRLALFAMLYKQGLGHILIHLLALGQVRRTLRGP